MLSKHSTIFQTISLTTLVVDLMSKWSEFRILLPSRYRSGLDYEIISEVLFKIGRIAMGRKLSMTSIFPFLKMGNTTLTLKAVGKIPSRINALHQEVNLALTLQGSTQSI